MSDRAKRALDAAVACLCKQDIPEVAAVIAIVHPLVESHWEEIAGTALEELLAKLEDLEDEIPVPDIDALAQATSPPERTRLLQTLLAAFLLELRTRLAAPLSAARQAALRAASRRLVEGGASALGLRLQTGQPATQQALAAAQQDLQLLMRGRLEQRVQEATGLLTEYLTSRTARKPAGAGSALLGLKPTELPGLAGLRGRFKAVLGLKQAGVAQWLPQTVDVWAYRWWNVGGFLAFDQQPSGLGSLIAQNNPPTGPDGKTTPFCRWVHGHVISVSRARQQVQSYVRASLEGDINEVIGSWPLLSSKEAREGTDSAFAVRFSRLGLPPYHWACRTVAFPRNLIPSE